MAGGFFGGDPNGSGAVTNSESGYASPSRVYVDFDWSGGRVSELWSNNVDMGGGLGDGYLWEIRADAAPGDGGTIVASSATNLGTATWTETPYKFGGFWKVFELRIDVKDFVLAPGHYHLAAVPGDGETYLITTKGTNSIGGPINNFDDLLDFPTEGYDFADIAPLGNGAFPGFSIGIVPAPGVAAVLAGVACAGLRRARRGR